ncbi:carboxylesterase family protein, partial [Myxococcota bacterium]|nr:carboxylesterase family protein [Myxococcota bacterium]
MSDRPKVETAQGWLEGRQTSGISRFLGVPYAKPPLGRLRFQPPEPPEPWSKSRLANRKGPVSMQAALPLFRFMNAGAARQSEDCLYLNIWSPGLDAARRPVLVWIHGGAFLIGAGSTAIYDGEWLARQGEMVVVTLNYRLGALGFVHLDNVCRSDFEQSSNLGLRDQLAALEWIRENIESFGGDASNVTVCGQSAGAMSVAALLGAGAAQRPFRRAILQSGAGRHVIDRARADRIAERFLEFLGKPLLSVEALSEIPTSRILRAQGQLNRELMNLSDPMVMLPCVDGELVREQPLQNVEAGRVRDVDLMIGTTLDEWKLFVPLEASFPPFGMNALSDRFSKWLPKLSRNAPDPKIAAEQYREAIRARGGRTTAYEVWSAYQSARIFH